MTFPVMDIQQYRLTDEGLSLIWPKQIEKLRGARYILWRDRKQEACYAWEGRFNTTNLFYHGLTVYQMLDSVFVSVLIGINQLQKRHGLDTGQVNSILSDFRCSLQLEYPYQLPEHIAAEYKQGFGMWGEASKNGIVLGGRYWTIWTVCHEVAHWLDFNEADIVRKGRERHGPHWRGWFVFLLDKAAKVNLDTLKSTLQEENLKWINVEE